MPKQSPPLRILLVDDDPNFAELVRAAIGMHLTEETPFELVVLDDGPPAIEYVLGRGEYADSVRYPPPDLLILDQRMRSMDGTDVLRELRAEPSMRRIPTCILSSSDQRKQRELSYDLGATFCITKPLELEELATKLGLLVQFTSIALEQQLYR